MECFGIFGTQIRVSHERCRRHQRQKGQDTLLVALDAERLIPCILTAPCERDLDRSCLGWQPNALKYLKILRMALSSCEFITAAV